MCAMPAKTIAMALGGRKAGGSWMARCPAHDDREPSLSIRDADDSKVLVHCHAGCDHATERRPATTRDCTWRWKREGRRVRIPRPPRGSDFNDTIIGCSSSYAGGV